LLIFLKFIGRAGNRGLTIKELSILTKEEFLNVDLNDNESIKELIKAVERKESVSNSSVKKMKNLVRELKEVVGSDVDDLKKIITWRKKCRSSVSSTGQSDLVWVNKNVVEKLLELELIEKPEKIGKSKYIRISEKGKMLLNYVG